jgi:purine-binding chemotaxis protein CheW
MKPITMVPNSAAHMRGVINLRGNVLPVIDLRIKFGMPATEFTDETCIIVLSVLIDDENVQLGILVDAVDEVLEIKNSEIEDSPAIGTKYKVEFIQGMYRLQQGFIMLLNMMWFQLERFVDCKRERSMELIFLLAKPIFVSWIIQIS